MAAAKDIAKAKAAECQKFYEDFECLKGTCTILQPEGDTKQ